MILIVNYLVKVAQKQNHFRVQHRNPSLYELLRELRLTYKINL